MKSISQYGKKIEYTAVQVLVLSCVVAAFFLPSFQKYESVGNNRFTVLLYGEEVGKINNEADIEDFIQEARKEIASENSDLVLIENPQIETVGEEVFFGKADSDKTVIANIKKVLEKHIKETLSRAYTVKVNNQTVNLASSDEVDSLLEQTIAKYDANSEYQLDMVLNPDRELNVLTAKISKKGTQENNWAASAGMERVFDSISEQTISGDDMDFDDYTLGLNYLGFSQEVEVVEAYLSQDELMPLADAVSLLTEEQEVQQIYEIKTGDTLSEISINVGIPMDTIVEMNPDKLENANSMIHVGDSLVITVPRPELSVIWTSREHYEESYEADIIYVPNDEWYTTQQVTLQEPSAGYREVIADVTYENDEETGREIVKQEVMMEAVPKIVERGTKIPPTYIKPISGGRFTSGFGRRKAPKAGASTYHKGIDWATAVGTPVYASSGGTVAKAGWGSGYGYVVYINHPDGRQTRYGHLSKILVSSGQSVSQGDKIALSGNSGVSTGPHVHFEILINGSQVNPLNYLN